MMAFFPFLFFSNDLEFNSPGHVMLNLTIVRQQQLLCAETKGIAVLELCKTNESNKFARAGHLISSKMLTICSCCHLFLSVALCLFVTIIPFLGFAPKQLWRKCFVQEAYIRFPLGTLPHFPPGSLTMNSPQLYWRALLANVFDHGCPRSVYVYCPLSSIHVICSFCFASYCRNSIPPSMLLMPNILTQTNSAFSTAPFRNLSQFIYIYRKFRLYISRKSP